jgi:gliding motility-associated-like protein
LQLEVASNYSCLSPPIQQQVFITPSPVVAADIKGICAEVPVVLNGLQLDNATNITGWEWNFGNGSVAVAQNASHIFGQAGNYSIELTATADNGCISNTAIAKLVLTTAVANAGRDTLVVENQPFQLRGSGGKFYNWTPPEGLSDPSSANPTGISDKDRTFVLTITTAEGCTAKDNVSVTVFKGSVIYVPTGFTPNDDGLNDVLRPYYLGIKDIEYFTIYNRWGQALFSSKKNGEGWNGTINGTKQPAGVYVWHLQAVDNSGKVYRMRGSFALVR